MIPEVQQLVAHLIQKGSDALHAGKPMVMTSPAGTSAATGMAKPIPLVSTTAQLWSRTATATAAEPPIIISIDDNEPMLTSNVTTTTVSIFNTVMMEEEELLRMKQICMVQESVHKLLQGCRSEQDLQEKIATLTSEWDVAINNAAVNLHQYKNLQKDNTRLAEEVSKLKKFQGSGETAPIVQKLKQQIKDKDDIIMAQNHEITDACETQDKACAELAALWAEHDRLRQEHVTQKHKLNTARDNIDALMVNNTKVQNMIMKLMNEVQAKQNSFDDLSTAHNDLQAWFDGLKYSMDTVDKQ